LEENSNYNAKKRRRQQGGKGFNGVLEANRGQGGVTMKKLGKSVLLDGKK